MTQKTWAAIEQRNGTWTLVTLEAMMDGFRLISDQREIQAGFLSAEDAHEFAFREHHIPAPQVYLRSLAAEVETLSDADLLAAWEKLECEADPAWEDALSEEIAKRELDV